MVKNVWLSINFDENLSRCKQCTVGPHHQRLSKYGNQNYCRTHHYATETGSHDLEATFGIKLLKGMKTEEEIMVNLGGYSTYKHWNHQWWLWVEISEKYFLLWKPEMKMCVHLCVCLFTFVLLDEMHIYIYMYVCVLVILDAAVSRWF